MKTCPYCGASLSEKASFCPHCAKSLIEKTDLKPYRTPSIHKFLFLLIPILILGSLFLLPWGKAPAPSPSENTEISATLTDTDTEITDSADPLPSSESEPADTDWPTDESSSDSADDSSPTIDSETPTDGETEAESNDPISDPVTDSGSESNTASVTDSFTDSVTDSSTDSVTEETQIIYTPETAPLSGTYVYKGVEWYYETPADLSQYPNGFHSYEAEETAVITGVNTFSHDGIYYVPETIYGRHVIMLGHIEGTKAKYTFNSTNFKQTIRKIYFPPEITAVSVVVFRNCNVLTDLYIGSEFFFLNGFPTKGHMTVHSTKTCVNTTNYLPLKDQCNSYSTGTFTCTWEEWDPSTLYPTDEDTP